jgi:hypothetical protein
MAPVEEEICRALAGVVFPIPRFPLLAINKVFVASFKLFASPLQTKPLVKVVLKLVAKRLVAVALVKVALVEVRLVKAAVSAVSMEEKKLVEVALVEVELLKVRLPAESDVKLRLSTQLIPFHLRVELVAVPEAIEPPLPAMSTPQENTPVAAL